MQIGSVQGFKGDRRADIVVGNKIGWKIGQIDGGDSWERRNWVIMCETTGPPSAACGKIIAKRPPTSADPYVGGYVLDH